MPSNTEIKEDTYLRHLPFSAIRMISSHLDPDQLWKKFIVLIPKKVDDQHFQEKYSTMQVRLFEERGMKKDGSPTRAIIEDWGQQNARVKHLLKVLTEGELYHVADYISVKLLKNSPVMRKPSIPSINFEFDSIRLPDQPPSSQNIDSVNIKKFPSNKDISDLTGQSSSTNNSTSTTSSSEDVMYHRIPSYDCYPSNDALAVPYVKNTNLGNSPTKPEKDKDTCILPEIYPSTKSQKFNYEVLCRVTNGFDDNDILEGGRLIGSGGFGKVFLGTPSNGYKIAIKTLNLSSGDEEHQIMMQKQFQTELDTLSQYRHKNIVPFIGYSADGAQKCLVYEYMPNGSLEDRLCCTNNTKPLPWKLRISISHGTAEGIVYLNDNKLVHRDIKSANVLLDENFSPRVGDFATVRLAPSGSGYSTAVSTKLVIGTSAYMAPEATRFDISAKLDSFAFGVVLLELLTGLPPMDKERSEIDLLSYIQENCDDDDISEYLDKSAGEWDVKRANLLYDISTKCVEYKKKGRVTVKDILSDLEKLTLTD